MSLAVTERMQQNPAVSDLTVLKPQNPVCALGLAVNYMMAKPAFARQPFGHWAGMLAGQINRGHYLFAVANRKVVGFLGWSFAGKAKAEDWLAGRAAPASDDSRSGEVMLINAWQADSDDARRFLLQQARMIGRDCAAVYAKRYRADGTFRPMRLAVNGFVPDHIATDALTFSFNSLNS
jgi:hemolysin-activating ACP:hemolysin acyltransferase